MDLAVAFVLAVAFAILGDERGEDAPEGAPDRGRSSSFRRPIWGVGGVEELAVRVQVHQANGPIIPTKSKTIIIHKLVNFAPPTPNEINKGGSE